MKILFGLLLMIASSVYADITIVIGQSNAVGIAKHGNIGKMTGSKVINCAYSGKAIAYFQPGGEYYTNCVKKVHNRRVANVIFWQGESDTGMDWQKWKPKALTMLRALHKDVCDDKTKLVIVLLNNREDVETKYFPNWYDIRRAQSEIKRAIKIDSTNYEFMPPEDDYMIGPVHLTANGYKQISIDIAKRLMK